MAKSFVTLLFGNLRTLIVHTKMQNAKACFVAPSPLA